MGVADQISFFLHDRYPGTSFMDHMERYHDDPEVKMLVMLGEVSPSLVCLIISLL